MLCVVVFDEKLHESTTNVIAPSLLLAAIAPPTPPLFEVKLQLYTLNLPLNTVIAPPYENALTSCELLPVKQLLRIVTTGPGVELERPDKIVL